MQFTHNPYSVRPTGPYTAEEAVCKQMELEAANYDGQMERMQARIDCLSNILGRLIDEMPSGEKYQREALARVIGCNWEPDE